MTNVFTVAGGQPINLGDLADELRQKIDKLPQGSPQLAASPLDQQCGVQEVLVVVRGNEEPHIHPEGDLIVSVLEGGGYFQLLATRVEAPQGSIIVIPKDLCHAYYNLSENDSVLLGTFSPINSKADCPSAF